MSFHQRSLDDISPNWTSIPTPPGPMTVYAIFRNPPLPIGTVVERRFVLSAETGEWEGGHPSECGITFEPRQLVALPASAGRVLCVAGVHSLATMRALADAEFPKEAK